MEKEIINDQWIILERTNKTVYGNDGQLVRVRCIKCGYTDSCMESDIRYRKECKQCDNGTIIGLKSGLLTVVELSDKRTSGGNILAVCVCECGNKTLTPISYIRSGRTKSCGCLSGTLTHGKTNTRIHNLFKNVKSKCYNPKSTGYNGCGAKGVTICQEWLDDFMNFYNWSMENGYTETSTLRRINKNGSYNKDNCIWLTPDDNKFSDNIMLYIQHNNKIYTTEELAAMYNVSNLEILNNYQFGNIDNYLNGLVVRKFCSEFRYNSIYNEDYYNRRCGIKNE